MPIDRSGITNADASVLAHIGNISQEKAVTYLDEAKKNRGGVAPRLTLVPEVPTGEQPVGHRVKTTGYLVDAKK